MSTSLALSATMHALERHLHNSSLGFYDDSGILKSQRHTPEARDKVALAGDVLAAPLDVLLAGFGCMR